MNKLPISSFKAFVLAVIAVTMFVAVVTWLVQPPASTLTDDPTRVFGMFPARTYLDLAGYALVFVLVFLGGVYLLVKQGKPVAPALRALGILAVIMPAFVAIKHWGQQYVIISVLHLLVSVAVLAVILASLFLAYATPDESEEV
ncbi:MAG TPA: hypothetical protein PK186_03295 [candidate division Zixibacteria bacterium]|nr:hypothetical protein [candidate division Zixibacteria bacterium]MDD4917505.1 hypothetical protein [candidate division Zixibacteria bacterium]HPM36565.1 hypothetical protein [candidate division Zixibacteria bacterium]